MSRKKFQYWMNLLYQFYSLTTEYRVAIITPTMTASYNFRVTKGVAYGCLCQDSSRRIVKEGRHLLVKKGYATYHTLFTYKLRQLLIFGNVEITHVGSDLNYEGIATV